MRGNGNMDDKKDHLHNIENFIDIHIGGIENMDDHLPMRITAA